MGDLSEERVNVGPETASRRQVCSVEASGVTAPTSNRLERCAGAESPVIQLSAHADVRFDLAVPLATDAGFSMRSGHDSADGPSQGFLRPMLTFFRFDALGFAKTPFS